MPTTKVMIVEDEALLADEICKKVKQIGYEVSSIVTSGESAVRKAGEDRPDVVLMDIRLPGSLDGIEAAEQIRVHCNIPVIYLTAHADVDSITRAKLTEPLGYLLKPVQHKDLQVTIDIALYKHKLQTELRETNQRLEQEIVERKQGEAKIIHLNAMLRAIRSVNQLITRETDRDRLLQGACDNFIETRGFSTTKILLMTESGQVLTAAEAGLGEQFQPFVTLLKSGNMPYCVRQGLASSEVVVIGNPPAVCGDCPLAPLFENDRKLTVRLEHAGLFYGLLIVSLPETIVADEEEQKLLQEVADDLALALHDIELEQERKQSEKALQESEERFRVMFESSHDLLTIADERGNTFLANPAWQQTLGYTPETQGDPIDKIHPDDQPRVLEAWNTMDADETAFTDIEYRYRTASGEYVCLETTARKHLSAGKPVLYVASHNITERKRAEEALQESEELHRLTMENILDPVFITDDDGRFTFVWGNVPHLLGYTMEELQTQGNISMLVDEDLFSLEELETRGTLYNIERVIISKDGSEHTFLITVKRVSIKEGTILYTCHNITEHKQAEERRYLLERVIETVPLGVTISDNEGKILYTNSAEAQMHGYTIDDLIGQKTNMLAPKDLWQQMTEEQIENVEHWKRETLNIRKDGSMFPVQLISTAVRDTQGEFLGLVTTCEDITERKQAEGALQESEERFRLFMKHLPGIAFIKDTEGRFLFANEYHRKLYSLKPKDLVGQKFDTFWNSDIAKSFMEQDRIVLSEGRALEIEESYPDLEGLKHWLTCKFPIFHQGEPRFIGGISLDITERKRAEEELRKHREHLEELVTERTARLHQEIAERKRAEEALQESETRFRTISDLISDYAYVNRVALDGELVREWITEAFMRITGYTPEEVDERGGWKSIVYPEDRDIAIHHRQEFLSGNETITEYRIVTKHGDILWLRDYARPVWDDAEGRVVQIFGAVQDITERKRVEEELRQAKEAAETANRLKSEFLANMSHDIRTPMNAILGFSEILKEQLCDFPQYQEYLYRVINSGHLLLQLINDILDLSKIEAGRLDIRSETVDLRGLLNEIYQMFSSRAAEKGIRFSTHISLDAPTTILLDGTRLRQILVNLVGNAIKFTEEGSVMLRVEYRDREIGRGGDRERGRWGDSEIGRNSPHHPITPSPHLLFEVQDTGIGIPQEALEQIFDPFQQYTRSFGGTGLGLAITKRLIEMMNGTICVKSTVNQGSVFSVSFPDVKIVSPEKRIPAEEDREVLNVHFHGATVLLVEDNAANREVICAYLASHDVRIVEAENGQEAIEILKAGSAGVSPALYPDLILMDIHMPVMGGDEATEIIKTDPGLRTVPVVALTAYALKEQREQFQELYDAYLSKPITKDTLIATLVEFLPHTTSPIEGKHPPYSPLEWRQGDIIPPLRETQGGVGAGEAPVLPGARNAGKTPAFPGGGILEDLEAYVTQIGTVPQTFLDKLQTELFPRHKEINEVMSTDEMIEFAEAVITVSDKFQFPPLKVYGEELLGYIKVFDITNIKRFLALFPDIVEIICGHEDTA